MKPSHAFIGMVICGALAVYQGGGIELPSWVPAVTPEPKKPAVGPSLVEGFIAAPDKTKAEIDARKFAYMVRKMARSIEFDGKQNPPKLVSGTMLHNMRVYQRISMFEGRELRVDYPAVSDAIKSYMIRPEVVGTANTKITPEERAKWVAAYDAIADQAFYAADYLAWKS